ncbi:MAG: hypothetical protein ABI614_00870, partial [Planctomycetota bacterium]
AGHALLFPSVVAAGSTRFPERYRGLGTTLMLAMFDIGSLIGAPLVGGILSGSRLVGLPAYTMMFGTVSCLIAMMAGVYWWRTGSPTTAILARETTTCEVLGASEPTCAASVQPATIER